MGPNHIGWHNEPSGCADRGRGLERRVPRKAPRAVEAQMNVNPPRTRSTVKAEEEVLTHGMCTRQRGVIDELG